MLSVTTAPRRSIVYLNLSDIVPNPAQPRRFFSLPALESLAQSIRQHGLLSPLLVRRVDAARYELIAGERRMRALMMLGRSQAEAIVLPAFDAESAYLALIENLQREDLHFLEQAAACRSILEEGNLTQEELAAKLGQNPSTLANHLRLLRLTPAVRAFLPQTGLTERHARALLKMENADAQMELAKQAEEEKLTVRQLEERIRRALRPASRPAPKGAARDMRLYVNAVMDTVSRLKNLGACADASVTRTESGTEIRILLRHE